VNNPKLFDVRDGKFILPTRKRARRGNTFSAMANPTDESKARMRGRILAFIRESGERGATCYEISVAFGVEQSRFSGRITQLRDGGHIRQSGTRPTETGALAAVYVAVEVKA